MFVGHRMGDQKFIISCSYVHFQLGPTNPHWACVVGYGPFSLCVIHKEDLYHSSGDIDRLMMIMAQQYFTIYMHITPALSPKE
jgi:hypothetical protein